MNIKSKDQVVVITGQDKGHKGKVVTAVPKTGKVVVEGAAMATMHKKSRAQGQPGGIIHKEAAIDASNVMLICPKCGKPTRVGHRISEIVAADGKKKNVSQRYCKKCDQLID